MGHSLKSVSSRCPMSGGRDTISCGSGFKLGEPPEDFAGELRTGGSSATCSSGNLYESDLARLALPSGARTASCIESCKPVSNSGSKSIALITPDGCCLISSLSKRGGWGCPWIAMVAASKAS